MFKEFIRYVSLNVISMLGISVYILCDTYFIANGIGTDALSGLNLVLPIFNFIYAVGLMIGMGTATKYSVLVGAGKQSEAISYELHGILFSLIVGAFFTIVGYTYTPELSTLLGADEVLFPYAKDYIGTIFLFAWSLILNNLVICISRAAGHPKLATTASLLSSFSNLCLDLLFIYVFKMGNFGAALATGMASVIAVAIIVFRFAVYETHVEFNICRFEFRKLIEICKLGFPSFITEFALGVVMMCFNFSILKLAGNVGIAAYSIIANIALVVSSMFTGVAQGIQPIIGYNFGAREYKNIKQICKYAYYTTTTSSLIVYAFFYKYSEQIIQIFNKENNLQLISMADSGIKIYFSALAFMGANIVSCSILSSMERAGASFWISISRAGLIVIPALLILTRYFGINGAWATIPTAEFLTMIISITLIKHYMKPRSLKLEV